MDMDKIAEGEVVLADRWNSMVDNLTWQREESARLRRELEAHERQLSLVRIQLSKEEDAHRKDIEIIGEALLAAAEEEDWCSEFDDKVAAVNDELAVALPVRSRTFEVDVPWMVAIEGNTTVQVSATSVDEARELAEGNFKELHEARALAQKYAYDATVKVDEDGDWAVSE